MATPLRFDMTLPNGEPLRWNTPGARWDGSVEDVLAALAQTTNNNMSTQNLVSATLSAQAVTNITQAIATIRTNLPFLLNLNENQRKQLQNVTDATQGIVQSAITFVAQNPNALPGDFNQTEFNKDAALLVPFQQVAALITSLENDSSDTLRALYSDLFVETLDIYSYAKNSSRAASYSEFINTVRSRYATGPRATKATAAPKP